MRFAGLAFLPFAVLSFGALAQNATTNAPTTAVPTTVAPTNTAAPEKAAAPQEKAPAAQEKAAAPASGNPIVEMKTSEGLIIIELDKAKAPVSVENFLGYVKKKHYDGTVFHRVIDDFMIQGGGFAAEKGELKEKATGKGIVNESKNGLSNTRGTIAMARTADPDSATAQFYINVKDNQFLDFPNAGGSGYAVFGKIVQGMDVVDKIKSTKTGQKTVMSMGPSGLVSVPFQDVPANNIVIESVKVK